ncbi:hypothetical protein CBF34_02050 [Vagococcus penaei]|uniref:Uncharacterized protein n=1 Tax=Vagococcus penaei TaxID=633807 RepID=A0A1Q2D7N2_9ENTE|nr:DUF3397 domain-containing protein [Vagococcus penaei]AQP54414.1 hypothetical protein BW732_09365 [Vagococcus penaei]RSU06331.1 hypothetical protein CBF34_02050 [Vagococcus penaei]
MKTISEFTLLWYIIPIALFILFKHFGKKYQIERKYGIRTPDLVTPFLLLSVHYISLNSLDESFFPYVTLMLLLIAMLVGVFQVYQFKELNLKKFLKMFWRITFLISFFLYLVLMIVSIILALK